MKQENIGKGPVLKQYNICIAHTKLMYKAGGILPLCIKKVKVKPLSFENIAFLLGGGAEGRGREGSMQL